LGAPAVAVRSCRGDFILNSHKSTNAAKYIVELLADWAVGCFAIEGRHGARMFTIGGHTIFSLILTAGVGIL
jgi:hypothetical protein